MVQTREEKLSDEPLEYSPRTDEELGPLAEDAVNDGDERITNIYGWIVNTLLKIRYSEDVLESKITELNKRLEGMNAHQKESILINVMMNVATREFDEQKMGGKARQKDIKDGGSKKTKRRKSKKTKRRKSKRRKFTKKR